MREAMDKEPKSYTGICFNCGQTMKHNGKSTVVSHYSHQGCANALQRALKKAEERAALLQAVADAAEQLFTFTPLREGETHLVMFTPALTLRYNVLGQAIKKWRAAA